MIDEVEVDLRGALPPVRDQGARSTCLAYATSAAHEAMRKSLDYFAPEYLYYFAKAAVGQGCTFDSMARALAVQGQPFESECPAHAKEPPGTWQPRSGLALFRRDSEQPSPELKQVIAKIRSGIVPILGIRIPDSFFRPFHPWVIGAAGRLHGGHAVLGVGVGRHDGSDVVLVRNSWGANWADGGYAWLNEAFLTQHLLACMRLTGDLT